MSIFVLYLNDMRAAQVENIRPVAKASSREQLERFMARETVERYKDGHWGKHFRAGGPLEWFNPPFSDQGIREVPDREEYASMVAQGARSQWDDEIGRCPEFPEHPDCSWCGGYGWIHDPEGEQAQCEHCGGGGRV